MKISVCKMVAHIKNAATRGLRCCLVPKSKFVLDVLEVLQAEGYVQKYCDAESPYHIQVFIKYSAKNISVIRSIRMVSKPSRSIFLSVSDLNKKSYKVNRFSTMILSTNLGVVSDYIAASKNVGGVVILEVSA